MASTWESDLVGLLDRLSAAQRELLALLAMKREMIIHRDMAALAALAPREEELAVALTACQEERQQLLARADAEGLPSESLGKLAASLPKGAATRLDRPVADARRQAHLVRHECLTQWVAVQRTVLHLSQMLEIIATGGRQAPTYGNGRASECGGALIDQAV